MSDIADLKPPPHERRRRSPLLLVWLVLLVLLGFLLARVRAPGEHVDVLFVGNSYTFYNDLPSMAANLANSAGHRMSVSTIAVGGAWLADHARSQQVRSALANGDHEVVVLQEQSMAPADPDIVRRSTQPAAADLSKLAAASGAQIVFFQTWGHASGNSQVGHGSYESMQDAITATYSDLAIRNAAKVAPAGEAWRTHFLTGSTIALHDPDGSHPNQAGSYLAAAVIAATITGTDPRDFTWFGPIDEATARFLLESASSTVLSR